jgi:hypothetical protein
MNGEFKLFVYPSVAGFTGCVGLQKVGCFMSLWW